MGEAKNFQIFSIPWPTFLSNIWPYRQGAVSEIFLDASVLSNPEPLYEHYHAASG